MLASGLKLLGMSTALVSAIGGAAALAGVYYAVTAGQRANRARASEAAASSPTVEPTA